MPGHGRRVQHFGPLTLDVQRREALAGGRPLSLSPAEFSVLHLLVSRRPVVMSREAIASALPDAVAPRMVDVLIWRIRDKLAGAGLGDVIVTVWGRGYAVQDGGGAPELQPAREEAAI